MKNNKPLTRFPEGSIKEIWTISLPLMISSLASLFMIFVDRCFLARYSLEALNASVNAGTLAWAFLGGIGMLTVMSEIFVAQYNGAGFHSFIGAPVWQMIWLSVFSLALFVILGIWIGPLFFHGTLYSSLEIEYFTYIMIFAPLYPIQTAISGFYIGIGKTRFLIYLAVFANFINIILDWILIFGIEGIVPRLGVKGAAIATSLGTLFQALVLIFLFLKKKNREFYGTTKWQFKYRLFKKCIKVGLPPALFYSLEIIGWALFYQMMSRVGELHITISSICQSIVILLSFFFEGLNRGISALAGNFIGSKKIELVNSLLTSSLKLLGIFTIVVSIFLIFDPKIIIDFLLPGNLEKILLWENASGHSFYSILKVCLICVFIYLFFEGVRWIFAGLLTAAGDTFFLLIAGTFSVWIFLLLPVYFIIVKFSLAVQFAWVLAALYAILLSFIYWVRFKKGKWKDIKLILEKNVIDENQNAS